MALLEKNAVNTWQSDECEAFSRYYLLGMQQLTNKKHLQVQMTGGIKQQKDDEHGRQKQYKT